MSAVEQAQQVLRRYFGFSEFREGQAEVIESVLGGHDSVVVMPTGGGKSLCYQLPAMMIEGITLVVSPLIALMKDQVDALGARRIPTTFINSSLGYSELLERLAAIKRGRYKLVYVAPERFRNEAFTKAIAGVKVGLFAVDEAHCISHWGHDFRPDYLRLREAAERLGRPKIIALTATATAQVRSDISKQLGLDRPRVFVAGFDRPNLALRVTHVSTEAEKLRLLTEMISGASGAGIVYAATRKSVGEIAGDLKMAGLKVAPYHAGMDDRARTQAQDQFMSGRLQAIVATNAFGMGIDKADIRFVVHYHIPGSLEAYYQEVGRAGRDALPADCLLMFNYADTRIQEFFIEGNHPGPDLIREVYRLLCSTGLEKINLSVREVAARLDVKNEMSIGSALVVLEKAGYIERGRTGDAVALVLLKTNVDEALGALPGDSIEGRLLRDLIFSHDVNDRDQSEVNLNRLALSLNLELGQARRSLSRLAEKGLISTRVGFFGRGIRLLDKQPARTLRIDKNELARRAAAEQWKLRRMIDYCYHQGCLRRFILSYFGDRKRISECNSCSSCVPNWSGTTHLERMATSAARAGTLTVSAAQSKPRPAVTGVDPKQRTVVPRARVSAARRSSRPGRSLADEEINVVKKILSCVARMNGRFGKGTLAAVLRGLESTQISDHQLSRLSTYGLLADMSEASLNRFIKALIAAGCIAVDQGGYPTVRLTDYGRSVMTGKSEVLLDLP